MGYYNEHSMENNSFLTEEVRIIAVERMHIRVETVRCQDCSVCAAGEGCRNSRIFRLFAPRRQEFSLPVKNSHSYKVGDRLEISFSQAALVLAGAAAYMVPLLLLLGLALIGHYGLSLNEPRLLLFILGGGVFAFILFGRFRLSAAWRQLFMPQLKKKKNVAQN